MEGYPKGRFSKDGDAQVEEEIILRAADFWNFVVESYSRIVSFPGGGWAYSFPRSCPGAPGLLTQDISFEPFDGSRPVSMVGDVSDGTYGEFIKLKVVYGSKKDDSNGDTPFLDVTADISGEVQVNEQGGKATWESSGLQVQEVNSMLKRIEPATSWTVAFPSVPFVVATYIIGYAKQYSGKLNSAVMPLFRNAAPDTVLFLGTSVRETFQYDEDGNKEIMNQLDMKFSEKDNYEDGKHKGHNHMLNPQTGKYDRVLINGKTLFQSTNLNQLWG
jgi:hypothetical protein